MASYRPKFSCDICEDTNDESRVVGFCAQCKELHCLQCLKAHMVMGMTRDHLVARFEPLGFESTESYCHICFSLGEGKRAAITLCIDCRELYCGPCKQRHVRFGATKMHDLQDIVTDLVRDIADDRVNLSSEFEKFIISADKKLSVSENDNNQQKRSKTVLLSSSKKQHNLGKALPDNKTQRAQTSMEQVRNPDKIDIDKISITTVTSVNCKTDGDTERCVLESIVCMEDGRALLLDSRNQTIKLLDHNLHIISIKPITLKVGWHLYRMIKISEQQIAVYNDKTVSFYNIKDNILFLHKSGSVEVYGEPIPYTSDKYASRINNQIKVYSTTGQELHNVKFGKRLRRRRYIFKLDPVVDRLYVCSCYHTGKIECFSFEGKRLWTIDISPDPVIALGRNNCLLIGTGAGRIELCNIDGTHRKTIINDIEKLYGISCMDYNDVTKQLLVVCTGNTDRDNEIAALKLSL